MPVDDGLIDGDTDFCDESADGKSGRGGFVVLYPGCGGGVGFPIGVEREGEAFQTAVKGFGGDASAPATLEAAKAGITGIYVQKLKELLHAGGPEADTLPS